MSNRLKFRKIRSVNAARRPASSKFIRSAGAVDYIYRQSIVNNTFVINTNGAEWFTHKLTYAPSTLLSAPFMSSTARLKVQTLQATFDTFVTNLNNFPLKCRVWLLRPKCDGHVTVPTGLSLAEALVDYAWVAAGGTTSTWLNAADFDLSQIPFVSSNVTLRQIGEATIEPQTEKLFAHKFHQGMSRARALLWNSVANAAGEQHFTRQDRFILMQVINPFLTGATSTGRATTSTLLVRQVWKEKWVCQNMALGALQSPQVDNLAVGTQTVFHRNYVTSGAAVTGNATLT